MSTSHWVMGGNDDVHRFAAVNAFARSTPWLHAPVVAFARYGVVLFAAALVWGWWRARATGDPSRVASALWAPVGTVVALASNQVFVHLVDEPRPGAVLPHALVLVPQNADTSYPSDHAVVAGAVAAGLFVVDRRIGVVTAALALLMAFSRVYVGAHFPCDVAAGLVIGAVVTRTLHAVLVDQLARWVRTLAGGSLRVLVATPDGAGAEATVSDRARERQPVA